MNTPKIDPKETDAFGQPVGRPNPGSAHPQNPSQQPQNPSQPLEFPRRPSSPARTDPSAGENLETDALPGETDE